ncbi:hypothetical protein J2X13_002199 [Aminobacter aminovorans]|nr:hypothetical protein [Aminobacter aminovorans]
MADHRQHDRQADEQRYRSQDEAGGDDQAPESSIGSGFADRRADVAIEQQQATTLVLNATRANSRPTRLPTTIGVQPREACRPCCVLAPEAATEWRMAR